jgi:pilus assembly protein CpaE
VEQVHDRYWNATKGAGVIVLIDLRNAWKGGAGAESAKAGAIRLGIMPGALTHEQVAGMRSLFPSIDFEYLEDTSRGDRGDIDILFVSMDSATTEQIERTLRRCRLSASATQIVVVLRDSDLAKTRALLQSGAVDVLPMPVSETALALCLERIVSRGKPSREPHRPVGQLVAVMKAGGGVGATSIAAQVGMMIAAKSGESGQVCFADLDIQFGNAALYFDMADALTVTDCLAVGEVLGDTQFATALAAHRSGLRLLAAPRDVSPLDILTPQLANGLIAALQRDFPLTIADLPSVWTAWTYAALQMTARIILVTKLSVPHVHLVRRQLSVLALQKLDSIPLTLICNAVNGDRQNMLSIKAAERAIGRQFDLVIPEDTRVMEPACNQGLDIASVRRGTKLEKAIAELTAVIMADVAAAQPKPR